MPVLDRLAGEVEDPHHFHEGDRVCYKMEYILQVIQHRINAGGGHGIGEEEMFDRKGTIARGVGPILSTSVRVLWDGTVHSRTIPRRYLTLLGPVETIL